MGLLFYLKFYLKYVSITLIEFFHVPYLNQFFRQISQKLHLRTHKYKS